RAERSESCQGFQTGDLVRALVPKGKKKGSYEGRVAVRARGSFNIKTRTGTVQGISWKYCRRIQSVDGYAYTRRQSVSSQPSRTGSPRLGQERKVHW
ncbi:MAG: hypothetical protein AAGJ35_03865, partial [Myxococcota bacterium]